MKRKNKSPENFFKREKLEELQIKYHLTNSNLAIEVDTSDSVIWQLKNVQEYAPNSWTVHKITEYFKAQGENISMSDFFNVKFVVEV